MASLRNIEGYVDPTAYLAMKNIERAERNRKMEIKRGDIWYVDKSYYTGSEQAPGRPAVIVSNDKNNANSDTVEVVYLTTAPKKDLPTHVVIRSSPKESVAICEQVTTVSTERIGNYKGRVSDSEMMNIEIALMVSLDINCGPAPAKKQEPEVREVIKEVEVVKEVPVIKEVPVADTDLATELARTAAERDMLQKMYDSLLSRVMGVTA